jgi:hypothetical protein
MMQTTHAKNPIACMRAFQFNGSPPTGRGTANKSIALLSCTHSWSYCTFTVQYMVLVQCSVQRIYGTVLQSNDILKNLEFFQEKRRSTKTDCVDLKTIKYLRRLV